MKERDLQILKASIDKVVRIACCNGETMLAKIHLVSDEDQDIVFDLVSTTRPTPDEKHDGHQPAYLMQFEEVQHVEPLRTSEASE
jgi:hypothetical protein